MMVGEQHDMDVEIYGRNGFERRVVSGRNVDGTLQLSDGSVVSPAFWRLPGRIGALGDYVPSWRRRKAVVRRHVPKKKARAVRIPKAVKRNPLGFTVRTIFAIKPKLVVAGPYKESELDLATSMRDKHPEAELVEHRKAKHRNWYLVRRQK